MRIKKNMGHGTSVILRPGDRLDDVPESHRDAIRPEIREAFSDPIAFFQAAASRCRFPEMAEWLRAVTAPGRWELILAEVYMMDRSTHAGFRFSDSAVASAIVSPPELENPPHAIEAFSHYYSIVDVVHWDEIACSGGLAGFGLPCSLEDYAARSVSKEFPKENTFVWGNTACGDMLVYTRDGDAGFLSHENSEAYSLGTVEEAIRYVFGSLLNRSAPEFDYERTRPPRKRRRKG